MFNSVQYVRDICKQKKIAISRLEKDCGFSNGYLNSKKQTKLPYDRAVVIAEYLDVSVADILDGPNAKKGQPTKSGELSTIKKEFISFVETLSEEQAARALRVLRTIVEELP